MDVRLEYLGGLDAGIVLLGLDRPAAKNALGRQLLREFLEALRVLAADAAVRVVVVHSLVPGVFCAGADLKERAEMSAAEAAGFVQGIRACFSDLERLPMPVIAALEGAAFGGGLELALAADLRVAGAEAKMGLVETALAIIPGGGGTQRLPRLIGVARAKELIFTARRFGAEEAGRLGLVNCVVPAGQALEAALGLAREILPNGPVALRMAKQAVSQGLDLDLASGLALEEACYAQVIPTQDRLEGLAAFREKRKPQYKGE
ncbi:MAG: enoyl-CoA hydratase/isomerase family protein [Geothrix sp.]|uniref:enoyl-CoA hydratase-related protein n=1 Tax=Geothrix sp. TaxID=1962974 RepID=UPI0018345C3F|nr:enoyl-CoA hydratase-related protein [Geothrix sp.]NWJ40423.1 enoyl-CoA hydratase/isomerase family protein [Geothrix sp.]WIL21570.1 MAG: enoyl-CoA hydratase-related protein [Geothrix sp.]